MVISINLNVHMRNNKVKEIFNYAFKKQKSQFLKLFYEVNLTFRNKKFSL